jgi:hypothetical protein
MSAANISLCYVTSALVLHRTKAHAMETRPRHQIVECVMRRSRTGGMGPTPVVLAISALLLVHAGLCSAHSGTMNGCGNADLASPRNENCDQGRMCIRGGSAAVVNAVCSPLKTFIHQQSAAAGSNKAPNSPAGAGSRTDGAAADLALNTQTGPSAGPTRAGEDEEGDSLMGIPVDRAGSKSGARTMPGSALPEAFAQQLTKGPCNHAQMHSAQEAIGIDPDKTCPWGYGRPVPFEYVCAQLVPAAAEGEPRRVQLLAELVHQLWQHSPSDLVPLACLLRDQILSPTLEGVELLPPTQLARLVADSFGKTLEGLREALSLSGDDLAATARKLRASQRTLFPLAPLGLARVVDALRDVAERSDMGQRVKTARTLLVAAGSDEVCVSAARVGCVLGGFYSSAWATSWKHDLTRPCVCAPSCIPAALLVLAGVSARASNARQPAHPRLLQTRHHLCLGQHPRHPQATSCPFTLHPPAPTPPPVRHVRP